MGQNKRREVIMKFSKKHAVPGLIGNLIVTALGVVGIVMLLLESADKVGIFQYFTVLSNVLVTLASFIGVILYIASIAKGKNLIKEGFQVFKLICVVCAAVTFTMVLVFLMPRDPSNDIWYKGSQLFMHAIVPIASVASFILLEYMTKLRFRFFFVPVIAALAYGAYYVIFAFTAPEGSMVDWYGFMFDVSNRIAPVDASKFEFGTFFLFIGLSIGGALAFGFVIWLLNKIVHLIFMGYTINSEGEEVSDEEVEELSEEPAAKESTSNDEVNEKEEKSSSKSTASKSKTSKSKVGAPKKYKDGARVYHIARSKFVSRSWQVKLAGGEKAIKIFPTQAEAIDYAKKLVRSQGGSIRIHSMKGQLRK